MLGRGKCPKANKIIACRTGGRNAPQQSAIVAKLAPHPIWGAHTPSVRGLGPPYSPGGKRSATGQGDLYRACPFRAAAAHQVCSPQMGLFDAAVLSSNTSHRRIAFVPAVRPDAQGTSISASLIPLNDLPEVSEASFCLREGRRQPVGPLPRRAGTMLPTLRASRCFHTCSGAVCGLGC